MDKYATFACGQVFHSYPSNMSFEEIINLCENDEARENHNGRIEIGLENDGSHEKIELCQRYEYDNWENIPTILMELADAAEYHFGEKKC